MKSILRHDAVAALKEIKAPIRGINSRLVPVNIKGNQEVADYNAVLMDGVGHFPHLEKPAEFNENLKKVLAEIMPRK